MCQVCNRERCNSYTCQCILAAAVSTLAAPYTQEQLQAAIEKVWQEHSANPDYFRQFA